MKNENSEQRELVDILCSVLKEEFNFALLPAAKSIADKLRTDTIITLPCKIGDSFYSLRHVTHNMVILNKWAVREGVVADFVYNGRLFFHDNDGMKYELDEVYFTREEAEAEKERRNRYRQFCSIYD